MKRALIIVASLIVVIGLVAVVYYLYFAPSAHLTVSTSSSSFPSSGVGTAVSTSTTDTTVTQVAPNFIEITSSPVSAGEVAFDVAPQPVSSSTSLSTTTPTFDNGDIQVEYIDRESGNVYAYSAINHTLTRISDKTLPGIQEASWLPDGSMAFVRFLAEVSGTEHIDSYALPTNSTDGYFLQQDLSQVSVLNSGSLFTLAATSNDSIGSTANSDGSNVQTIFTSPLTSLIVHPSGTGVLVSTKASSELNGYAFSVSGSAFTPILGPLPGLTVLPSPDGTQLLFSYLDNSVLKMSVLNLSSGVTTALPLATLAEKCVWSNTGSSVYCAIPNSITGNIPDDWYQGAVSFTDRIWRIDLSSRLATLVLDPSTTGKVDIDAVNLTIDPDSRVLVFRNKKDSSLWAYSL